ncbi:hypothetical protein A3C21_03970 [Candidatus Kaiserbacteria bacterium RIFCSPHIGHO2_02_FULL_59_21]|uniref:Uncharacterized protein n=1 Tax=Candidatus Kaiserbacteria bacterium RIFCSPHIGHO2_02_FULL_59_21 TaxID=1798500 RepID=A0A1F6DZG8_9BACT|nr:MAG: hypothetical protein A2766_01350 [Candidatus Kaiserbacteria bacterium RIFCSPHIGHO2_01_FULL_58_22]OGG66813.1 MAG: hypothetical protein A3C21_03970 [Candidatus Kaiserbacteria bacterium RIFCSPHIGHO2_02_FULL_59_21]OGG79832.1 MAG: hypothetical protein A2952_00705 [Candidatus Kaiserbacteria bacterium RIFCSPLOWO2_01_FULL_59_34]
MDGHRHLHARKRMSKSLEPYPARTPWKRMLDRAVLGVGILGPIMSIPQIALIYISRDAAGVSPVSFLAWALFDIPWIVYGLVHREPPIVVTYTLWLAFNLLIFLGALIYG